MDEAEDFPLPGYLEELLEELAGPLLREDVERGRSREEVTPEAIFKVESGVEAHRESLLEAFVKKGFSWSMKKTRVKRGRLREVPEPQVVVRNGRPSSGRREIQQRLVREAPQAPRRGPSKQLERMPTQRSATAPLPPKVMSLGLRGTQLTSPELKVSKPRPVTPKTPPQTQMEECPMAVRALVPSRVDMELVMESPEPRTPIRTWTSDSFQSLPEDDLLFGAISGHRGVGPMSGSFLRQLSPMLRQISPSRFLRQSSDVEGMWQRMTSETIQEQQDGENRGENQVEKEICNEEDEPDGQAVAQNEDSEKILEHQADLPEHQSMLDAEEAEEGPCAVLQIPADSAQLQEPMDVSLEASLCSTPLREELQEPQEPPVVYVVPPWRLREHLRLEGAQPPVAWDPALQALLDALKGAPALRNSKPSCGGPPRMGRPVRRLLASPEQPRQQGPAKALGTTLLSMFHPSRGASKAQLQAQQTMARSKMPRLQAVTPLEAWRPGQRGPEEAQDPDEGSETFFLTD